MGFSWQTDEDGETWWAEPDPPHTPNTPRQPRPWKIILLLSLLLITTIALIAHQRLQTLAREREADIRADVLASYTLLNQAIKTHDPEVLLSVLSGSDRHWSQQQQTHLADGWLLTRPFLGWQHQPLDHTQIRVATPLNEAYVTITQTYHIASLADPVRLRHTATFRRGRDRWLYTYPKPNTWGNTQQLGGPYLNIHYPQIDAPYITELNVHLNEAIDRYCAQLNGRCQNLPPLHLHLTTDAATLPALFQPYRAKSRPMDTHRTFDLPTPTLVGHPTDTPSRAALYDQYAIYVLAVVNRQLLIGQRVGQAALDRVLFNEQLLQMGFPPYLPPTDPDQPVAMRRIAQYQSDWAILRHPLSPDVLTRAQELIDFLRDFTPDFSPIAMQAQLNAPDFATWLTAVTNQPLSDIDRYWRIYAHERARTDRPPPFEQAPSQLVGQLCTTADGLTRYTSFRWGSHREWRQGTLLGEAEAFKTHHHPLPNDAGFVLTQEPTTAVGDWYTTLAKYDGSLLYTFNANNWGDILRYTGLASPDGQRLVMRSPHPEFGFEEFYTLDLTTCTNEECPLTPIDGLPFWSPAQTKTALATFEGLAIGNGDGQRIDELGRGRVPFWVNETMLGYLRPLKLNHAGGVLSSETGLVLLNTITNHEHIYTLADLLGRAYTPNTQLEYATKRPHTDHLILLTSQEPPYNNGGYQLFSFDLSEGRATPLFDLIAQPALLSFDPHGRWLTLTAFSPQTNDGQEQMAQLILYNLNTHATPDTRTFWLPASQSPSTWQTDWDKNGNWLVVNDAISLTLINPTAVYHQRLFHRYQSCTDAVWLDP